MKTILLTGASGDIGIEIARTFIKKKYRTILVYNHNRASIDALLQEFNNSTDIFTYQCDLTIDTKVREMVEDIIKNVGTIDSLINCAGISHYGLIQDESKKDFDNVFDTNVKSTFLATKYVSKYMISEKKGQIVNISSMWGKVGSSMESLYSASKGAINSFTLSLAKELGPSNIRVNAICPGLIESKMNSILSKETIDELIESTPLSRIGKPIDVAKLALYLCSDDASFITGQIISVDGGFAL